MSEREREKVYSLRVSDDWLTEAKEVAGLRGIKLADFVIQTVQKEVRFYNLVRAVKSNDEEEEEEQVLTRFGIVRYDNEGVGGTTIYESKNAALEDASFSWDKMTATDKSNMIIFAVVKMEGTKRDFTSITQGYVSVDKYITGTLKDYTFSV